MAGEQLVMVLRLDQGQPFSEALRGELAEQNRRLPDYKRVRAYLVWERDFPRTASLKIKRDILAQEIGGALDRSGALKEL